MRGQALHSKKNHYAAMAETMIKAQKTPARDIDLARRHYKEITEVNHD